MVVGDFNLVSIASTKLEAHAILVVDADTPLSSAVSRELFKPMGWRDSEVVEGDGGINALEPHPSTTRDLWRQSSFMLASEDPLCPPVPKALNHFL